MIYYGETKCQGIIKRTLKKCNNWAYYEKDGKYLCGVHSKNPRNKLPINPRRKEIRLQKIKDDNDEIEKVRNINFQNNKKGNVIVSKLRMMKAPEDFKGYLKVFPNYKHQNRKDGFGCSKLSPKSLGPVIHNMPNLPPAKNIENYHQFAKFFSFEVKDGKISENSLRLRCRAYEDCTPHRHKFPLRIYKMFGKKNVNIPLFSMYYDKDGKEHRYTYIQCRYFYCHWYEKLAKETDDYKKLINKINNGYNLQIVGYDGYNPTKDLYEHYLDSTRPFGHELVLYSLLVIDNPDNYPWNIYYNKYNNIYKNVI
jgi:hypothetical protein